MGLELWFLRWINWDSLTLGSFAQDLVAFFLSTLFYPFILFFRAVVFILPPVAEYPLPQGITDSLTLFLDYAYQFDFILPVNVILSVVGYAFIFYSVLITFRLVRFIINISRGSGA